MSEYNFKDKKYIKDPVLQLTITQEYHMFAIKNKRNDMYIGTYWKNGNLDYFQTTRNIKFYKTLHNAVFDFKRFDLDNDWFEIVKIKFEEVEKY